MIRSRATLAAVAALGLTLGCPGDDGGVGNVLVVGSVEVTPGITTVILNQTLQLTASPKTTSGLAVPGRLVTWTSSSASVASVSSTGVVTGVSLGGPVTIRARVDGVTGEALITVLPVPVNRVAVLPSDTPLLVGGTVKLTATAFDAANTPLSGRSFLWQSSAPNVAAVTSDGTVIGQSQGGPVTITATTEGKSGTATVSVATRPATRLAFAQQPAASTAGAPFNPQIRIALQDDLLTTVIGANNPVTIALAGNPGNATLGGTLTMAPVDGIATFGNLTINRVGNGYTFLVTSPGLVSATSLPFNVAAGPAAQLGFTTSPPAAAQSGAPLAPQPVLQLLDGSGNVVQQAGVQITATVAPGAGSLNGTATAATNAQGVATFTNLAIVGTAGSYTLSFGAPGGIATLNSGPIALGAGSAVALSITTQPSPTAQNATPLGQQPAVQLRDGAGNPVAQAGIAVNASLATGTGSLGGATSATTNSAGLATFASLAINGAAGNYTIRFSAPGAIAPVVSDPVTLGAGAQTQIAVTVQPSATAQVGVPFVQQPSAQLRDVSNNPVAAAGVTITATASAGGTLVGTAAVTTDANGVAAFTGLSLSGLAGNYTISFSSPGLTPATSGTITLSAGAAAKIAVSTQPSAGAQSGVAFAQQPRIQVQDAGGNQVPSGGIVVSAILASGVGTIGGTQTATTTGTGLATFTNLAITGASGTTYTIQFSAPGLGLVVSSGVTLGAGAATAIAANSVTTQSAVAGTAVAAPPSVRVTDASLNPVPGIAVTFAVTAGGGTVVPAGPATVLTDASGIATATSWTLGPAAGAGNNTVTASAAVPGSPITFTASGLVGPANIISANSATSQSATVSTAVAAPPSVRVTDANNNPVTGINVTFTVTAGAGAIVPASPAIVATNGSGIATLTSWTVGSVAGTNNNTVSATAAVPNGSPVTFSASGTAAGAGSIAANSVTTQSATVGTAVAAPPSVRVLDGSSNPVPGVPVTFTVTGGGGSTVPVQVAVVNTNGLGIATLTSWTLGTTAGTNNNTLSATQGALGPVVFTATATAAAANTIAANSPTTQSAPVGSAVAAPPSVIVTDQFGNPVGGVAVSFAVTSGGGTVVPASPTTVVTSPLGIATATSWTLGPAVGVNTVNATAAVPNGSPVVFTGNGTAGGATNIAANSATTQNAVAGTAVAAAPSVRVTDGTNPVQGVVVTFAVTGGGGSISGPAAVSTDVNGIATVGGWTLGPTAGTNNNTLTATSGTLIGSPVNFIASGTVGVAALITAQSSVSQSATVGTGVAAPSVRVTDINGNVVASFPVTFTLTQTGGAGGAIVPATPASVNTAVNGIATLTSWTLGQTAGTNNNTVTATGTGLATITFNASGTAGSAVTIAANSVLTQSATAGTAVAAPPSVTVTDTFGNPVALVAVTFTLSPQAGSSISPASPAVINTNALGIATLTTWTLGNAAGTNNNTVTATAAVPSGSPVTFTASAVAGAPAILAAVSTTSQSATAGSAVAAPPSVRVTDNVGNGIIGISVTFTLTAAPGASISPASPASIVTDGTGLATLTTWTLSTTAGANTVTATAAVPSGSPVTFNATGTAGAPTSFAANSVLTQSADAGTAVAAPPAIRVTDANGNGVINIPVTFTLSAGGATVPANPAVVNTNASGLATLTSWTLDATAGNTNSITATGAVAGSPVTFTATGNVGAPAIMVANSVTSQSATVATAAVNPSVHVTDAHGNAVTGFGVTFTLTAAGTGGSISPASPATVVTDGLGNAVLTTWTLGTAAGTNNNTVVASGVGAPVTFNASGIAGNATDIVANSSTSQSGVVNTNVAAAPSVLVTDTHGNPKIGVSVTFAVASGGGSISPAGPATIVTDAAGLATLTTWTLGTTAGNNNNSVTATSGTLLGSPVTFTATALAGQADHINILTQPGAPLALAPTDFLPQPKLEVLDIFNNPVAGQSVTVSLDPSGSGTGTLTGNVTLVTDSSGTVTYSGLGVTLAGDYVLKFTVALLSVLSNHVLIL